MSSLAALRVLDLSEGVAGPYCTKLLADYGAEVIKIERPGRGDPARRHGPFGSAQGKPFADDQPHPERSALFLYLNTNKKGITLDITQSTGARLLRRLIAVSEVIVESYPPGYLADLGLGYATLSALKPRLVMTSITPFGQSGPYSSYRATNLTAFAAGGQMSLTGEPDREPLKNGGYQAEYQAGLHAFAATAVAAVSADATEVGQHVDISAMECQASVLELYLPFYAYLKRDFGQRRGNVPSAMVGIYPCQDGHIGIHCMPRHWPALAKLMQREDLLEDERFRDAYRRLQHNDELEAIVRPWAAGQRRKEVYQKAGAVRAPLAFVHTLQDLLDSPQLQERRYFQEIDHPQAGRLTYPGPPFRPGGVPLRQAQGRLWQAGRAPLLGEHNVDIYCGELGLSREELGILRASGII